MVLCLGFVFCGRATEPLRPCTGDDLVLLTISSGTTPRFTWDPACLAFQLLIQDSANVDTWGVQSDSSMLVSGIDYGLLPRSARQLTAPAPLQPGKLYAVGLFRYVGPNPGDVDLLTAKAFRP